MTFNPRCGSVSMVRFDGSDTPQAPVTLGMNLNFPDGITVVDSSQMRINFKKPKPSPDIPGSECVGAGVGGEVHSLEPQPSRGTPSHVLVKAAPTAPSIPHGPREMHAAHVPCQPSAVVH